MTDVDASPSDVPGILPVYIVVDTSTSMSEGNPPLIDIANEIVPAIVEVCEEKPTVRDKLRLSLIEFSSDARVVVPLGSKDDFVPVPILKANGATNFSSAFAMVASEIENGYNSLKASGVVVYRPVVFLVTDGAPTDSDDERDRAFRTLTNPTNEKLSPHVIIFGVAAAPAAVLKKYVNRKGELYVARAGVEASEALSAVITGLVGSIVASTNKASEGGATDDVFSFNASDIDDAFGAYD
jgi:uncharacterized protein YegL